MHGEPSASPCDEEVSVLTCICTELQDTSPGTADIPLLELSHDVLAQACVRLYKGENKLEPDVRLKLGDTELPAHRCLLAESSDYFKAMFQASALYPRDAVALGLCVNMAWSVMPQVGPDGDTTWWKYLLKGEFVLKLTRSRAAQNGCCDIPDLQSGMSESKSDIVHIQEVAAEDMEVILKFLYGVLDDIPEARLPSLVAATNRLQVSKSISAMALTGSSPERKYTKLHWDLKLLLRIYG